MKKTEKRDKVNWIESDCVTDKGAEKESVLETERGEQERERERKKETEREREGEK